MCACVCVCVKTGVGTDFSSNLNKHPPPAKKKKYRIVNIIIREGRGGRSMPAPTHSYVSNEVVNT